MPKNIEQYKAFNFNNCTFKYYIIYEYIMTLIIIYTILLITLFKCITCKYKYYR